MPHSRDGIDINDTDNWLRAHFRCTFSLAYAETCAPEPRLRTANVLLVQFRLPEHGTGVPLSYFTASGGSVSVPVRMPVCRLGVLGQKDRITNAAESRVISHIDPGHSCFGSILTVTYRRNLSRPREAT